MPRHKGRNRKGAHGRQRRRRSERQAIKEGDPEYKSLTEQLRVQGLKLKDVPGDGNCLFRSLCDQLSLVESERGRVLGGYSHTRLRQELVQYMREHPDQFEPFMEVDDDNITFEEYLEDLSKDGTFCGNDIIVAASKHFNCSIMIHQPNAPRFEVHPPSLETSSLVLQIAYLYGEHYCSVHKLEGGEKGGASYYKGTKKNRVASGGAASISKELVSKSEIDCSKTEQALSTSGEQTGPTLSLQETIGIQGIRQTSETGFEDELELVLASTGCQDRQLAEKVLSDNCYDAHLATIELLQLMELTDQTVSTPSLGGVSYRTGEAAYEHTVDVTVSPSIESVYTTTEGMGTDDGRVCQHTGLRSLGAASKPHQCNVSPIQRHLSNKERKELAKKERKERRLEEKRKGSSDKEKESKGGTKDPLGSLTI
ncbi:PREDICTED: OTU domain-containing protein 3-like isoform X1 [Amphimedon queenslandica]|uniref:OTU domain-containing protein n=1 Tax=Amphimedon queenslandica TaxID=400682 RepID=A0A1X7TER5_AMPQE|nr:PREDICTED: OTU domain-containing protein 3-like isoform X1 [Amphimedon queenslandica]XP_019859969.1 PREDICTED: OTU domain-containing protein 3-like isoform X1 [Amphimedon queenslandica]XP_019859970.1 PREDICTED: OTU domain-containing protein 3-like isoform X1 [Amphimedon queenslandica]|eukprot:XP_019859968.1 PREDICTED: OTU domain-containing protein 3-like isoform X1 [Amphimedon queenslandica]